MPVTTRSQADPDHKFHTLAFPRKVRAKRKQSQEVSVLRELQDLPGGHEVRELMRTAEAYLVAGMSLGKVNGPSDPYDDVPGGHPLGPQQPRASYTFYAIWSRTAERVKISSLPISLRTFRIIELHKKMTTLEMPHLKLYGISCRGAVIMEQEDESQPLDAWLLERGQLPDNTVVEMTCCIAQLLHDALNAGVVISGVVLHDFGIWGADVVFRGVYCKAYLVDAVDTPGPKITREIDAVLEVAHIEFLLRTYYKTPEHEFWEGKLAELKSKAQTNPVEIPSLLSAACPFDSRTHPPGSLLFNH
jgi:hypothetical protein